MNYIIKNYPDYNTRRYSTPWVARCTKVGRPDFSQIGFFTGGEGKGGDLFVNDPPENSVWVYGQKDYRGGNTEKAYAQFRDGAFHPVTTDELLAVLAMANPSRADAIRAMSDEELNEFIGQVQDDALRAGSLGRCKTPYGGLVGLRWLQAPKEVTQ